MTLFIVCMCLYIFIDTGYKALAIYHEYSYYTWPSRIVVNNVYKTGNTHNTWLHGYMALYKGCSACYPYFG